MITTARRGPGGRYWWTAAAMAVALAGVGGALSGCSSDQKQAGSEPAAGSLKISPTVAAAWGSDSTQAGHTASDESAPEGPPTALADASGALWVLDSVNVRLLRFAQGKAAGQLALPPSIYEDFELDGSGGFVLLDIYQRGSLVYVDSAGKLVREVPIWGDQVPEHSAITGLFRRADGVWIEVEDGVLVRVADASGQADATRPAVSGRFSAKGDTLVRAVADMDAGKVAIWEQAADGDEPVSKAEASFTGRLGGVTGLETDTAGRVFLSVLVDQLDAKDPAVASTSAHVIVVFDAAGKEVARGEWAAGDGEADVFRPLRLGGDGLVYFLRWTSSGVEIARVTP